MIWTIIKADFLYTLMLLPLTVGVQLGLAFYQRRQAKKEQERLEAGYAAVRARNAHRKRRLFGQRRRRLPVAIYRGE